jgi:fatty acid desaturase
MPSPPSRRRRRHRSPTPYAVWLLGVFLSYGIMGAVLYAFVPPWWIWLVVGVGVLLLTWSREELAIVMNQARSQLQATFETPRLVWILLGISALGLGSGILSVLLFNRLT